MPFAAFLITLEVFAASRFPIWEPAVTTRIDDIGVRRFTGNLRTSTRDHHLAAAAFHQVSAFRRLAEAAGFHQVFDRNVCTTALNSTGFTIIRI
uniref:Uncharacterized protein n=1 Tax=Streptomyces sp. NBC_00180 TaxID=2903632 RepID=A0AAU1IB06_9ACTN